jgi:alpha-2-macroglobulin
MQMTGAMSTIDVCDEAALPKTLEATEGGRDLQVHWLAGNQPYIHYFTVDSIQRGSVAQTMKLVWDGNALGTDQKGERETEIPALGDFKVFSHSIV